MDERIDVLCVCVCVRLWYGRMCVYFYQFCGLGKLAAQQRTFIYGLMWASVGQALHIKTNITNKHLYGLVFYCAQCATKRQQGEHANLADKTRDEVFFIKLWLFLLYIFDGISHIAEIMQYLCLLPLLSDWKTNLKLFWCFCCGCAYRTFIFCEPVARIRSYIMCNCGKNYLQKYKNQIGADPI